MRVLVVLAAVLQMATPASANGEVDAQHWHNVFVQGRLVVPGASSSPETSPALFYLEAQPRLSLLQARPERVLFRGALGWELARGLTLWGGVGAIPVFDAPHWSAGELRLWQQVMFVDRLGPVQLMWRGRMEQRAFEGGVEPALRARVMLRGVVDLPVADWAIVAFDEAFVGVAGPASRLGFDQNRAFVGVMHRVVPWMSIEGGYLWVQVGDPAATSSRTLHTVLLQTIVNLL